MSTGVPQETLTLDRSERDVLRAEVITLTAGDATVGTHLEELDGEYPSSIRDARAAVYNAQLTETLLADLGWEEEANCDEFVVGVESEMLEALLVYVLHMKAQGLCDMACDHLEDGDTVAHADHSHVEGQRAEVLKEIAEWRTVDGLLRRLRGTALLTPGNLAVA